MLLAVGIDEVRARLAAHRPPAGSARLAQLAVLAVAVVCCLPLLPRPLPVASAPPLPAGWSAVFARLHLAPGSRVLVLPFPIRPVTLALRWSADSGEPSAMTGGYFIGPGKGGQAHVDGKIRRHIPEYLNYLWAAGLPPGSPYIGAARMANLRTAGATRRARAPAAPSQSEVHAELARWRPQAVVADARVSSPLGQYLATLLGPPSVRVDDLIGWRLSSVAAR